MNRTTPSVVAGTVLGAVLLCSASAALAEERPLWKDPSACLIRELSAPATRVLTADTEMTGQAMTLMP
jgi:hypothetical protein